MSNSTTLSRAMVIQTQEEERYRLARELRNGPAQVFANAALEIETSLELLDDQPAAARAGLQSLIAELKQGLADLRDLIAELQPPLLEEYGLGPSLSKFAHDFATRSGIAVTLSGIESLSGRLPSVMQIAIFRIVQEALENVRCHSRATRAEITATCEPDQITVTIQDNGRGFFATGDSGADSAPASPSRTPQTIAGLSLVGRPWGLVAMSDRAELLNGQLKVFSERERGVRVVLTVPLHHA